MGKILFFCNSFRLPGALVRVIIKSIIKLFFLFGRYKIFDNELPQLQIALQLSLRLLKLLPLLRVVLGEIFNFAFERLKLGKVFLQLFGLKVHLLLQAGERFVYVQIGLLLLLKLLLHLDLASLLLNNLNETDIKILKDFCSRQPFRILKCDKNVGSILIYEMIYKMKIYWLIKF